MGAVLLGLTQVAIGWLVIWCCVDRRRRVRTWWPFDYRTDDPAKPPVAEQQQHQPSRSIRQQPASPWKPSGF
jgi:hypothetical protein